MAKANYSQIAREITESIVSGQLPVGTYLPTELELCEQYDTSRHTIRAALNELLKLGFVSRKKNAGTRIESAEPTNGFIPSLASVNDLVQFGSENIRQIQSIEEIYTSKTLAKQLNCEEGQVWLRISSLRFDKNRSKPPVGWTYVYIDPIYIDIAQAAQAEPNKLISSLIEAKYGRSVSEIEQHVYAITLNKNMSEKLGVKLGSAALEITRSYIDSTGKTFEISVSTHPAERFHISMKLKRSE